MFATDTALLSLLWTTVQSLGDGARMKYHLVEEQGLRIMCTLEDGYKSRLSNSVTFSIVFILLQLG